MSKSVVQSVGVSEAQCKHMLKATLCDEDFKCCENLCSMQAAGAVGGVSFSLILALVLKYGPQVVAILKEVIDQMSPTPAPMP